jgi:hypothetical protein
VRIATRTATGRKRFRLGYLVLAVVAAGTGTATYAISSGAAAHPARAAQPVSGAAPVRAKAVTTPSAAEFNALFVGLSNTYAKTHGDTARFTNADCVKASPGHYMCSYAITRPNRASECHLMQARWTPEAASSFTVTLSGRVTRCGSLREALRSLK